MSGGNSSIFGTTAAGGVDTGDASVDGLPGFCEVRYLTGYLEATGGVITIDGAETVHTWTVPGSYNFVVSAVTTPITGTLVARSAGSDRVGIEGLVTLIGDMVVLSSDSDGAQFSATGGTTVSGNLAGIESGEDRFVGAFTLTTEGSLSGIADGAASYFGGTGTVNITGELTVVLEGGDLVYITAPLTFSSLRPHPDATAIVLARRDIAIVQIRRQK